MPSKGSRPGGGLVVVAIFLILAVAGFLAWKKLGGGELGRLKARAEAGEAAAQRELAALYAEGKTVPLDKQAAFNLFSKAAEQGDPEAEQRLGEIYELGRGVPSDYEKSARWFRAAAEQGYAPAQISIGMAYQLAEGVTRDYAESYKWLQLAVNQGDTNAVVSLSDLTGAMSKEEIQAGKERAARFKPKK